MTGKRVRAGFTWSYVRRIVLEHRRELALANAIAVLAAAARVPLPLLFPLLVDEVLLEQPGRLVAAVDALAPPAWRGPFLYIATVLLLTVLLRLLGLGLSVLQNLQFTRISKEVIYRIRSSLLARLQRVSMAEYETLGSGGVASRLTTDLKTIDEFLGTTVSKFLVNVLTLGGVAAVLLWMHWQLALFILAVNPLVVLCTIRLGRWVKELKRRENEAVEQFQESLTETLDTMQQIRASNREGHYFGRLDDRARRVRDHATAFAWQSYAANLLSFTVFLSGFDVFRALALVAVVFSDLTIGQMLAVFSYLWTMMGPVQELLRIQYAYFGATAALGRLSRLDRLRAEPEFPHLANPFAGTGTVGVELENVSFAYGPDGPAVLDGIDLHIRPGEKVALVGASGGGKSTLVQALLGLYPATSGRIAYGGVDVSQIGLDVVRENVATVLQQPAMLQGTVRDNLLFGRQRDDAAIWRALDMAQLRPVIEGLEGGLDAPIGLRGVRLSGGQRQRLAIARMILAEPKVVILDEATSALDLETERSLHEALASFLAQRTTLIVAHRLSALRLADRVLVFDGGRLEEQGTHEELLARGGVYAQLYGHR